MGKNEKIKGKNVIKGFFSSLLFLKIFFGVLIILVITLGVLIYQKESNLEEKEDAHITVPVYQVGTDFEFGIDAALLNKESNKEYILKITNYKGNKKIKEDVPYQIIVENPTDSVISIKKNHDKDNLMQEQKTTIIEDVMPSKDKVDVYYHIVIDSVGNLQNNDFYSVKIVS